jgi:hypothetical protein
VGLACAAAHLSRRAALRTRAALLRYSIARQQASHARQVAGFAITPDTIDAHNRCID